MSYWDGKVLLSGSTLIIPTQTPNECIRYHIYEFGEQLPNLVELRRIIVAKEMFYFCPHFLDNSQIVLFGDGFDDERPLTQLASINHIQLNSAQESRIALKLPDTFLDLLEDHNRKVMINRANKDYYAIRLVLLLGLLWRLAWTPVLLHSMYWAGHHA